MNDILEKPKVKSIVDTAEPQKYGIRVFNSNAPLPFVLNLFSKVMGMSQAEAKSAADIIQERGSEVIKHGLDIELAESIQERMSNEAKIYHFPLKVEVVEE